MPIKIDSVFYELALHDEDFAAALRKSVQNLDQLDQGAKKASQGVGGLENSIRSARGELKRFAENVIEAAALREFVRNTINAQAALAQLQAALRSTAGAAGFTLPELVKMSEELSKLSTFSSEAVQGGLSRLLTYTGIQGPMFREAARATIDFATALGIDTTSAAERVGNALQYPTEAINSLTKQGFRFTSEQKRLIAAFEDTGQLAKAQAIILGELDLAYKGSAEAARSTLGGALIGLKNDFMSTLEVSKESSSGLIEAINSVASAMPSLRNKFNEFFGGIALLAVDASVKVQKFLNLFRSDKNKISDAELEAFRIEEQRKILGLDVSPTGPPGKPAGTTPRGLTDAQIQAQRNARAAFAAATAALTPDRTDNFEATVDRLVAAAKKAHLGTVEIQKMVAELRGAQQGALAKEGHDLEKSMLTELAKSTGLQAAELRDALDKFDEEVRDKIVKGVPIDFPLVAQLRAAKIEAIALAEKADDLAATLVRIDHDTAEGHGFVQGMRALNDALDVANADFASAKASGNLKGMAAAQQRINTILAEQKKLQDAIATIIAAQNAKTHSLSETVQRVAGGIAGLANTAFGLVSAFAGANSELAKMLGAIGQAAGGIESLTALANVKDKNGNALGLGGLLSSKEGLLSAAPALGQIIGGGLALAASIFGKSPEEIERLRLLKQNNAVIQKLTDSIGDLAKINVAGTDLAKFSAFLKDPRLATVGGQTGSAQQNNEIGAILDSLGLSAQGLIDFGKSFGIAVGTGSGGKITIDDIHKLQQALANTELNQFADDFTGQMQKLNAEILVFSLTKPIEQFEAFRKVLAGIKGGTGALGSLVQGLDLTTAAGIDAARKAVEDLFTQFQTLAPDQLAGFLGGLTPQEFLDAIAKLTDFINAQAGSGAVAGTGGFNVSRTITEVTGNRLEALLTSSNIFAEQTARNTGLIAQLLGGDVNLPMINPPAISSAVGSAAGTTIVFEGGISVTVSGVADPSRGRQIGELVSESMIAEIDRKLAGRVKWNRRAKGLLN